MGRYRTQAQWKEHYKKQKLNKEKMGLNKENSNASATFLGIKEGSFTKGTGDDKVKLDDKQTDWFIDNLDLSVVEDKSSIDLPNSKSGTEVNPIDIIEDMKKKGDWEVSEKANSTEGTDDLPF
jgi:hypothetical protein